MRRKSENLRFEISYSMLELSGGGQKNLNIGAQLHTIIYYKAPKTFLMQGNTVSIITRGK